MTLNEFAAKSRLRIFDSLSRGDNPPEGEYSAAALAEAKVKGMPLMGTTRYTPERIYFEFIYPDPISTSQVFTVAIDPPERIVFMPVPSWVVENIWQGDIAGTYHFESDSTRLLKEFEELLERGPNLKLFDRPAPKRRE